MIIAVARFAVTRDFDKEENLPRDKLNAELMSLENARVHSEV
jgi:hypothetical protein